MDVGYKHRCRYIHGYRLKDRYKYSIVQVHTVGMDVDVDIEVEIHGGIQTEM